MDRRNHRNIEPKRTGTQQPSQPRRFVRTFVNSRYHQQRAGIQQPREPERTTQEEPKIGQKTAESQEVAEQRDAERKTLARGAEAGPRDTKQESAAEDIPTAKRQQRSKLVSDDEAMPGPSGMQGNSPKQHGSTEQQESEMLATSPRPAETPDTRQAEAATQNEEPIGLTFNDLPQEVQMLMCDYILNEITPNQTRLGADFATLMQILSFNGCSGSYISDIHTVAVCQDSIILIRRKGIAHSYIFEWRTRQGYTALKIMATLRERGYWTCERIKIFHTAPRMAFGDGTPTERTTLVMHTHLTQLLRRFGATKEVKITDCPFFWEQVGVGSLQQLTTSLPNTPIIRGTPGRNWMPGGNWNGIHQHPMLLRRADVYRHSQWDNRTQTGREPGYNEQFACYATIDDIPAENHWMEHRFPPLDFSEAMPTLQVLTWEWQHIYQKITARYLPNHFERIDITLSSLQTQPRNASDAVEDMYNALDGYPRLRKLTITIQTTDYKDDLWENGDGEMLAAYVTTMMKQLTKTVRDSREPTVRNHHRDRSTEIQLLVNADDWYTTEDDVLASSTAVREAAERYVQQHTGLVTVNEGQVGRTVKIEHSRIADNCTISASVTIGRLVYGTSTRNEHNDRRAREVILANLGEYLRKDLEEDA